MLGITFEMRSDTDDIPGAALGILPETRQEIENSNIGLGIRSVAPTVIGCSEIQANVLYPVKSLAGSWSCVALNPVAHPLANIVAATATIAAFNLIISIAP